MTPVVSTAQQIFFYLTQNLSKNLNMCQKIHQKDLNDMAEMKNGTSQVACSPVAVWSSDTLNRRASAPRKLAQDQENNVPESPYGATL